jgi:hypothetical protein
MILMGIGFAAILFLTPESLAFGHNQSSSAPILCLARRVHTIGHGIGTDGQFLQLLDWSDYDVRWERLNSIDSTD